MRVDPLQIKAVLNGDGREDEIVVDRAPAIGSVRVLHALVGRKALCKVRVLDTWPCVHGGHVVRFRRIGPLAPRPLRLDSAERSDLLAGDVSYVERDLKPDVVVGEVVVLTRERAYVDREHEVPSRAIAWWTVTALVERGERWRVTGTLTDDRPHAYLPARGGGWTTSRSLAIDDAEGVLDQEDVERISTEARAALAERRLASVEDRRKQERAVRDQLRRALDGLDPQGQAGLLAAIQRDIAAATGRAAA